MSPESKGAERLSIAECARGIRAGRLTSELLVAAHLERIVEVEVEVRAFVVVDAERALERARAADRELAAGEDRGPLHGVPFVAKDIYETGGLPTEAGSPLLAGHVSARDAEIVARLARAGAVLLGKTTTSQWAWLDPTITCNPWDTACTPGGSSAGSAAAVAARCAPAALGSQTGGSIGRPAGYCGIVGFKPSFGIVPLDGVAPVSPSLDHAGFFARDVADVALFASAVDEAFALPEREDAAPRIGVLRPFFQEAADGEMRAAAEEAAGRLGRVGAEVGEAALPDGFDGTAESYLAIVHTEVARTHAERFARHRDGYGPNIRAAIEAGQAVPEATYRAALEHQARFRRALDASPGSPKSIGGFDALLTPASVTPAPRGFESTGSPAMQIPWSFGGVPTVVLPASVGDAGLPRGIQLVGHRGADAELLRCAAWCERVLGFDASPRI